MAAAVVQEVQTDLADEAIFTFGEQVSLLQANEDLKLSLSVVEQQLSEAFATVDRFKEEKMDYERQVQELHNRFVKGMSDGASKSTLPSASADCLAQNSLLLLQRLVRPQGKSELSESSGVTSNENVASKQGSSETALTCSPPTNHVRQFTTTELVQSIHQRMDQTWLAARALHEQNSALSRGSDHRSLIHIQVQHRCNGMLESLRECSTLANEVLVNAAAEPGETKVCQECCEGLKREHLLQEQVQALQQECVEQHSTQKQAVDLAEGLKREMQNVECRMQKMQDQTDDAITGLAEELERCRGEERTLREVCAVRETGWMELSASLAKVEGERDHALEQLARALEQPQVPEQVRQTAAAAAAAAACAPALRQDMCFCRAT
eukprot:998479-Rhodomonas_salina.1